MKEKLEQLTLAHFVDLLCGNMSVILTDKEDIDSDSIAIATRNIVLEYRAIADPGGTNSYFKYVEDWIKTKISIIIFTMCDNLAALKQYDRVREILDVYGISTSGWSDTRIEGTIKVKLSKAQRELEEIESETEKAVAERENIRSQFDTQTASLMAHFKFQIDPATIKATLYANLVARYNREVKALKAAMRNKK